jgi:hypothetical protein
MTRALPAVARLLLPCLLLAGALTAALLVLGSGAAHADALVDDPVASDSVDRAVEAAAVGSVPSAPQPSRPADSDDAPAPVTSPVERTASKSTTSVHGQLSGAATGAASADQAQQPVTTVAEQPEQLVKKATAEVEKKIRTATEKPESVVREVSRIVRDVETLVTDAPLVGEGVNEARVGDRVEDTLATAVGLVPETGAANIVDTVVQTLGDVAEPALDAGLPNSEDVAVEETGSRADSALHRRATDAGSAPRLGHHRWLSSQREIWQSSIFSAAWPGENAPPAAACRPGEASDETGDRSAHISTPAGITTGPGAGSGSHGGMGAGWAATLPSTWLAPPVVGLQPTLDSGLSPSSGPSLEPGFSPD